VYPFIKTYQAFSVTAIIILDILNSLFLQDLTHFPSNIILLTGVFILPQILLTCTWMLKFPQPEPLHRQGIFWYNTGNFIFYVGTLFLFGYFNAWIRKGDFPPILLKLLWLNCMLIYFLYGLAVLMEIAKPANKKT
jgi:hypothetical protein